MSKRFQVGDTVKFYNRTCKYRIVRRFWWFGWVYGITAGHLRYTTSGKLIIEWCRAPELDKAYTDEEQRIIDEMEKMA